MCQCARHGRASVPLLIASLFSSSLCHCAPPRMSLYTVESSPRLGGHPQSSSHNPHSSLESASDHQHGASAQTAIVPHYIAAFKKSKYMSNGNLGELRILMVDDSLQCCKINHNLLKEKNHSVIETDSGKVAVDMIKKSLLVASFGATNCTFDVVLLSGTISDMTGWEVAKLLRLDGFFGLILGLMHGPTSHDATKHREMGADGILTKPLSVDDFNQTIYGMRNINSDMKQRKKTQYIFNLIHDFLRHQICALRRRLS